MSVLKTPCPHVGPTAPPRRDRPWPTVYGASVVGLLLLAAQLSCSESLAEPAGPSDAASASVTVEASLKNSEHDSTGRSAYTLDLVGTTAIGTPASGAPLSWSSYVGSDSVLGEPGFGPDGTATLRWVTHDTLAPLHLLEIWSGEGPVLRIAGRPSSRLVPGTRLPGTLTRVDTVKAVESGAVAVRLIGQGNVGLGGQTLEVRVTGGGRVDPVRLTTDPTGYAAATWQLGPTAGTQSLEVSAPASRGSRLVDVPSGTIARLGQPLTLPALALPGAPQALKLGADTVVTNTIGARIHVPAMVHDAYGNIIAQPPLSLSSPDSAVAAKHPDGSLHAVAAGIARVYASAGTATDSFHVLVIQQPVTIGVTVANQALNYLGARTALKASAVDRLGAALPASSIRMRSLDGSVADLTAPDTVAALAPGLARIEVSVPGAAADTVTLTVAQVPAAIALLRTADTLDLDQAGPIPITVRDSGGALIAGPALALSFGDTTIAARQAPDSVLATFPGQTTVKVQSGTAIATYDLTVEGTALLVNGVRTTQVGDVTGAQTLQLSNGRVRLHWGPESVERGAFLMETRVGTGWVPANVRGAGDWLYVTSTVTTNPTSITIQAATPTQISVAMRYGNHWFQPAVAGFPSNYQAQPFPFTRTMWLNTREYGYYSWTQLDTTMQWAGTELEVGFGGLFGPASVTTGSIQFRTDTLSANLNFDTTLAPDAVQFDLDGDPLMRVIVPLPEAPLISPFFPGWGYGSVYIHRLDYKSYGGYMYAAPRGVAVSPRALCLQAWSEAPFPLHQLTPAQTAACGPL